ncbi:MAG: hypothetical protein GY856_39020 [bacterium]|nr:hypothetical protein [bacterium]
MAADPESAQAKRDLSVSLVRLANVAMRLGELDRARQHLDRALDLSKATADAHPTDPYLRRTELIQHVQALGLALQAADIDALRQHSEVIEEILTAFDARGLFRGDAQIERVRNLVEKLRTALDEMEP